MRRTTDIEPLRLPVPRKASPYRNNAGRILPLSIDASALDREEQVLSIATQLCPFLVAEDANHHLNQDDDDDDDDDDDERSSDSSQTETAIDTPGLVVKSLAGGLSNELFVVENTSIPVAVLVRIHPDEQAGSIVNRSIENQLVAWLSHQSAAPVFYGRFLNGRVEEFYAEHRPLSFREMASHAAEIGSLMAGLHVLQVPTSVLPTASEGGDIWSRLEEWLAMAREFGAPADLLAAVSHEFRWLQSVLRVTVPEQKDAARRFLREICLTHGDLQSLNLLTPIQGGPLKVIDFEYAGRNPRAYDMANTFCEFMDMNNLRADFVTDYPTDKDQDAFLRGYMAQLGQDSPLAGLTVEEQAAFLTDCRHSIGQYTLVSHLGWAIWSCVQDQLSEIDFDYIAYAQHRLEGYHIGKQRYFDSNR